MPEKLKRITSEADHHKVLDIAYLFACFVGLQQALAGIQAIQLGIGGFEIWLLVGQMMMMSLAGAFGYYWHIKGSVFNEFIAIFPALSGIVTVMIGTAIIALSTPPKDPFIVNFGGLAFALGVFLSIELIERIWKIQTRKKQIKLSKIEREKTARRSPDEIAREAAEVIDSLEA